MILFYLRINNMSLLHIDIKNNLKGKGLVELIKLSDSDKLSPQVKQIIQESIRENLTYDDLFNKCDDEIFRIYASWDDYMNSFWISDMMINIIDNNLYKYLEKLPLKYLPDNYLNIIYERFPSKIEKIKQERSDINDCVLDDIKLILYMKKSKLIKGAEYKIKSINNYVYRIKIIDYDIVQSKIKRLLGDHEVYPYNKNNDKQWFTYQYKISINKEIFYSSKIENKNSLIHITLTNLKKYQKVRK